MPIARKIGIQTANDIHIIYHTLDSATPLNNFMTSKFLVLVNQFGIQDFLVTIRTVIWFYHFYFYIMCTL